MGAEDKLLDNGYEGVVYLTNPDYEPALIGVSTDERAVYDYDAMVEYLIAEGMDEEEAMDHIDYNVVGAYIEDGPIIMRRFIE